MLLFYIVVTKLFHKNHVEFQLCFQSSKKELGWLAQNLLRYNFFLSLSFCQFFPPTLFPYTTLFRSSLKFEIDHLAGNVQNKNLYLVRDWRG